MDTLIQNILRMWVKFHRDRIAREEKEAAEKEVTKEATGSQAPPQEAVPGAWACQHCTFTNTKVSDRCQLCERIKYTEEPFTCEECTYVNRNGAACVMCATKKSSPWIQRKSKRGRQRGAPLQPGGRVDHEVIRHYLMPLFGDV